MLTAVDAQGPLSTGDNSNPAFAEPARVGDVAWVDIAPLEGWEHPNYIVPGIAHVAMSLDDVEYEPVGASLVVGAFTTTTRVYCKIASVADPAPKLVLPVDGFVEVVGNLASGAVASTSGAGGTVNEIETAAGAVASGSAVAGGAVQSGARDATGVVASTSGAAGSVTEIERAEGSAAATSAVSGDVNEKEQAEGGAVSTSGATGGATISATGPLFSETWNTLDTGVWGVGHVDAYGGALTAPSAVGGNLRLPMNGSVEEADTAVVYSLAAVVDNRTAGRKVSFTLPAATNLGGVCSVWFALDVTTANFESFRVSSGVPGANLLEVVHDYATDDVIVTTTSTERYRGGSGRVAASYVIEMTSVNQQTVVTVKREGVQIAQFTLGAAGAAEGGVNDCTRQWYLGILASSEGSGNLDVGDVTVEAL